MPLVANVGSGVVSIYREDMTHVSERVFIAGGVADVTGDQCTLLAEQAINVNDINMADIDRQITDMEDNIKITDDNADKARFEKRLAILRAMREAA
jgi:F-type H+-transporting ATPase subunit epsilon